MCVEEVSLSVHVKTHHISALLGFSTWTLPLFFQYVSVQDFLDVHYLHTNHTTRQFIAGENECKTCDNVGYSYLGEPLFGFENSKVKRCWISCEPLS